MRDLLRADLSALNDDHGVVLERPREPGHELRCSSSNEDLNDGPSVRDSFRYPDDSRYVKQFSRMPLYGYPDRHGSS